MTKAKRPGTDMELAKRENPVVQLHNAGYSYRRIAQLTGMSKSSCQRTYREVLAEARGVKDIERHRALVFDDIEAALDELRPWILRSDYGDIADAPVPMTKDLWGNWWKALKAKREFLGLDAPKGFQVTTNNEDVVNDEAAEFLADLAVWMRRTGALEVRPVLPPGMTERVDPNANGRGIMNGKRRGSMWSMVLDFPPRPCR
jgi:hypothetical protein